MKICLCFALLCGLAVVAGIRLQAAERPNFIIIFCDDLGYSDVACFGSKRNRTPHIDRMAREGTRFTDFYVTAPVCSPSRASLLTGCYPLRVDLARSSEGPFVLLPADRKGLNPEETTIAELLRDAGYVTACVGKWHLGDQPGFMPNDQGFDHYFGIPFSNDMKRKPRKDGEGGQGHYLPFLRDREVIELSPDQRLLTRRLTEDAIGFIRKHREEPFFLYLPHVMPHRPVYASDAFAGKSPHGTYSDAIEELDWSVGRILSALEELGIDDNTLVVFTSDNGATRDGENHPLRGGKAEIYEGGMRVPCVMRWPARMPAGRTVSELITCMDLLPTFAGLAGAERPAKTIDGYDIAPLLTGAEDAGSPYEKFFYYRIDQLRAVRSGKWKLHLAVDPTIEGWKGEGRGKAELALYDLESDIGETTNVAEHHREVVERLRKYAEEVRKEIGDWEVKGSGQRPAGMVDRAVHPSAGVELEPTNWIGNPDSELYKRARKKPR